MWTYSTYDQLYHSGIKGQKWGNNRYQLSDGTWTEEGLARRRAREGGDGERKPKRTIGQRIADNKKKKQQTKNLEKARAARAAKKEAELARQQHEADKEKILRSGSAKEVMAYKGELTNQQYNEVLNRLDNEAKLAAKAFKEEKTVWDKLGQTGENIGKATKFAENAISAYNVFAKVVNSMSDTPIPVLNGEKKEVKKVKKAQAQAQEFLKDIKKDVSVDDLKNEVARLSNLSTIEDMAEGNFAKKGK